MVCDLCDGYGIILTKNHPLLTVGLNDLIRPSKKGGSMPLAQAQDYLNKRNAAASRDTSINVLCPKCNGSGI